MISLFAGPLAQISLITFLSIAAQWIGWALRIPAIVFLLLSGFIFGSFLGFVQPESFLGSDLIQPIVSIAVGIILFEGSLNLNFREIKQARQVVWQVVIIGAAVCWTLTSLAAHYIGGLSWPVSITFGALLIVTGPTVIMPLLRQARLNTRVGSILKWEGIVNDPVGAVLAVLAYEFFKVSKAEGFSAMEFTLDTGLIIVGIIALSVAAGWIISRILNKGWVPEFLKAAFLLSIVVILFVTCNYILHESGLIAVTVMGIVLANTGVTSIEDLKRFKESITIMLVSGVFVILTANIKPDVLLNIDWRGVLFVFAVLFVIRPLTILCASVRTTMTWPEVALIGFIAPRGVVCAAIAGIMGPLLVDAGYADGEKMLPLAFMIVLATVIIHGLSAKPLGQKLGLAFPSKDGLIIVGATEWTIQFAQVLKKREIDVMIADRDWHKLKSARLSDIPIYYGEILSEETEHVLELNRYNTLLAATGNPAYNALVCNKYAHDFGRERVFQLSFKDEDVHERQQITHTVRGRTLAYEELAYWDFARLYQQGWRFKATKVSAGFNLDELNDMKSEGTAKLIGTVNTQGQLQFSHAQSPKNLKADTVAILFTNDVDDMKEPKSKDKKKDKDKNKNKAA